MLFNSAVILLVIDHKKIIGQKSVKVFIAVSLEIPEYLSVDIQLNKIQCIHTIECQNTSFFNKLVGTYILTSNSLQPMPTRNSIVEEVGIVPRFREGGAYQSMMGGFTGQLAVCQVVWGRV